jgi:hypothetical protein
MAEPLHMIVGYPPADGTISVEGPFPILVHVSPETSPEDPLITVTVEVLGKTRDKVPVSVTPVDIPTPPYNRVLWVDGVPPHVPIKLHITATRKDQRASITQRRLIGVSPKLGAGGPHLTICSPAAHAMPLMPGVVPPRFVASGFVDPSSALVCAWVVELDGTMSSGGIPIQPAIPPCDWSFAFGPLEAGLPYTLFVQAASGGITSVVQARLDCKD